MRKLWEKPSPGVNFVSFNRRPSRYCAICSKQALPFCLGKPYHGVTGRRQEHQEHDHPGYGRGPVHPNRALVYEDESSEDEAYAHEVFGGGRDQGVHGQRDRGLGNHEQGGRIFGNFESRDYRMKMDLSSFNGGSISMVGQPTTRSCLSKEGPDTYVEKEKETDGRAIPTTRLPARVVQAISGPVINKEISSSGSQTKVVNTGLAARSGENPNPYTKASGDKCYRFVKLGHRSNMCPKRATVNLMEPVLKEDECGHDEGDVDPYSYDPNEFQDDEEVSLRFPKRGEVIYLAGSQ
ncbi:hypothetical protein Acr_09g0002570 [Actinidia rufa]|uniref:Uncharacterized protein n=1 Tax=Actinidia rufa TaxID=165716 RepID=A0A7J0F5B3_9ERIC|nr:hypothetical protein Acr_09g0002570 [Actinidia rufa]